MKNPTTLLSLFFIFLLPSFVFAIPLPHSSPDHLNTLLLQQQEQQRQHQENQQQIQDSERIRDSRVSEGVVAPNSDNSLKQAQKKCNKNDKDCLHKQQCNIAKQKCLKACNDIINNKLDDKNINNHSPSSNQSNNNTISSCQQSCTTTYNQCITNKPTAITTCPLTFTSILPKGNKVYSTSTLNKEIINSYIGKCINKQNLTELQSQLTNFYISNGYTMARVYFDMEHITQTINPITKEKETTFIILIEEGIINEIVIKRITEQQQQEEQNNTGDNNDSNKDNANTSSISSFQQFRLNLQSFFAFPFKKNSVFNIKDFEQGLDQMNRLQSNNVTMEIRPSSQVRINENGHNGNNNNHNSSNNNNLSHAKDNITSNNTAPNNPTITTIETGFSDIILTNNQSPASNGVSTGTRTTFLSLNYSNSGNKNTGENVMTANISQDNLLSINDNLYISYTESSDSLLYNFFHTHKNILIDRSDIDGIPNSGDNSANPFNNKLNFFKNDDNMLRYNKSLYTALSFPLGYWTFNSSLNYSTYKTTINGYYSTFHTTGETITQSHSIDRVMYRNQQYKLNIGTNLTLRDTLSYIQDLKSETGTRKSSNIDIYLNNTIYTQLGTIIIKLSYQKGLAIFGSKTDKEIYGNNPILNTEPRLQYNLLRLFLYYNTRLNVPLLSKTQLLNQDGTNATIEVKETIIQTDKEGNPLKDRQGNPITKEITKTEPYKVGNQLPINYTLTFNSQYSFNTLYGADQFSIGGEYTIRGFRESAISGDNGFYVRNDVRVNVGELLPRFSGGSRGGGNGESRSNRGNDTNGNSNNNKTNNGSGNDNRNNNNGNNTTTRKNKCDSSNSKRNNNNNNNAYSNDNSINDDGNNALSLWYRFMNHNSFLLANESINSLLSKTYLSIFYDYGYVRDKYADSSDREFNSKSGSMSGIGVSLAYYGKYLNWSLTYSKALSSPKYLQTRDGVRREESSVYWRVGGSW